MTEYNKIYKEVFKRHLEPKGFRLLKGSNIFVRLVNKEILQIIGEEHRVKGMYSILINVKSIYYKPQFYAAMEMKNLLHSAKHLLSFAHQNPKYKNADVDALRGLAGAGVYSLPHCDINVEEVLERAARDTEELVLPEFDKITDIDSCIDFYMKYSLGFLCGEDNFEEDSLLLLKAKKLHDFEGNFQKTYALHKEAIDQGKMIGTHENTYKELQAGMVGRVIGPRDRILSDPELLKKAHETLEHMREENSKMLRSYGFEI